MKLIVPHRKFHLVENGPYEQHYEFENCPEIDDEISRVPVTRWGGGLFGSPIESQLPL